MQFRTTGHHHWEMGIVVWVGWDKGDLAFIQLQMLEEERLIGGLI
jgi:hypothetical protein